MDKSAKTLMELIQETKLPTVVDGLGAVASAPWGTRRKRLPVGIVAKSATMAETAGSRRRAAMPAQAVKAEAKVARPLEAARAPGTARAVSPSAPRQLAASLQPSLARLA